MPFGGGSKCLRCDKTVYHNEEVKACGGSWHKECFNCGQCGKRLEPGMQSEAEGNIWCKACYGKAKGPKGFG